MTLVAFDCRASPDDCERPSLQPPPHLQKVLKEHSAWLASRELPRPQGAKADLARRDLTGQSLAKADLRDANLHGAKLEGTVLDGALLDEADLGCVLGAGAHLKGARLFQTNLVDANLTGADLSGEAKLVGAHLDGANLAEADLSGADLGRATLAGARLYNTKLAGSDFSDVDLKDAIWQPYDLPAPGTLGRLRHLASVRLDPTSPDFGGMGALLAALRGAGLDDRARELVHALELGRTSELWDNLWRDGDLWSGLRAVVRSSTWGLLTSYGLSPLRGLLVAISWNLFFAIIYVAWGFDKSPKRKTGLYRVFSEGEVVTHPDGARLSNKKKVKPLAPKKMIGRVGWALTFASLMAARTGIGSLNVMDLIGWLSSREAALVATGGLRFVAGIQGIGSLAILGVWMFAVFT